MLAKAPPQPAGARRVLRGIATLAFIALASGASAQAPKADSPTTLTRSEASFLKKAAEHGRAEVELGRLAQEKGLHAEVKAFGARMVADHGKAAEELARIAGARGLQLPTAPEKKHERALRKLREKVGPDFDREYMKQMLADHRKDVRDFERMAKNAKDADVRDFASRQAGVLRSHLQAAQATYDLAQGSQRTGDRETGSRKP